MQLPPEAELEGLPTLELDLALSCPGHVDADCPAWDHVLQLFVCCSPPCTPCQVRICFRKHYSDVEAIRLEFTSKQLRTFGL